jgi:hypothetical protein
MSVIPCGEKIRASEESAPWFLPENHRHYQVADSKKLERSPSIPENIDAGMNSKLKVEALDWSHDDLADTPSPIDIGFEEYGGGGESVLRGPDYSPSISVGSRKDAGARPLEELRPQLQETDLFTGFRFFENENMANRKVPGSPDLSDNGVHQSDYGRTNHVTTSVLKEDSRSELSLRVPYSPNEGLLKLLLEEAPRIYEELDKLEDSGFALGLDILPNQIDLYDDSDRSHFTGTSPAEISLAHLNKEYEKHFGYNMKQHNGWMRSLSGMLFQILRNMFHRSPLWHSTWGLLESGWCFAILPLQVLILHKTEMKRT